MSRSTLKDRCEAPRRECPPTGRARGHHLADPDQWDDLSLRVRASSAHLAEAWLKCFFSGPDPKRGLRCADPPYAGCGDLRRRRSEREFSCCDLRRRRSGREFSCCDLQRRRSGREFSCCDLRRRRSGREFSCRDLRRRSSAREFSCCDLRCRSPRASASRLREAIFLPQAAASQPEGFDIEGSRGNFPSASRGVAARGLRHRGFARQCSFPKPRRRGLEGRAAPVRARARRTPRWPPPGACPPVVPQPPSPAGGSA